MLKRVLGLDIGKASLGWSVVDLDEDVQKNNENGESLYKITNGKIIGLGVRLFDEPIDRQGKSLAEIRGENRRTRATIERKRERLKYLIKLAKHYDIIPDNFNIKDLDAPKKISLSDWDIWKLRAKAVRTKLSNLELFRILYHIANHRGFYFPTKSESLEIDRSQNKQSREEDGSESKEDKKIKAGISVLRDSYKQSGYKTIGEYIYYKEGKKRNKENDYSVSIYRLDLCDEVKTILDFQRKEGNLSFSSEFEERYINEVLMYNHPLDDNSIKKMIGECELIKGELRFPKHGYEAELFTFYNRFNNLKINSEDNIDCEKILNFALNSKNCKVTFSDLRKFLNLNENQRFNLCSYYEYNPEYQKSISIEKNKIATFNSDNLALYDCETGEIEDSVWSNLKEITNAYFAKYVNAKNVKYYYSDIRKQLNIPMNKRFVKLKKDYCLSKNEIGIEKYLAQFEKETFVEFSGYNLLKKGLGDTFEKFTKDNLNDIAEALVYYQSDEARKLYLEQCGFNDEDVINKILELNMKEVAPFSRKALSAINDKMKKGLSFNQAKSELGYTPVNENNKMTQIIPYHGMFEKNATVARIIAEFRKTVNAISKKYGTIDEIHIELATDVANSKKKIIKIKNEQIRYKEQREAAYERCLQTGINPDEGDNLLRFRLAEEQDFKCIYTNQAISLARREDTPTNCISIFDCDIDHIIPISRSFNDSLANKVICSNLANREKSNRLPYEWFHDSESSKTEEDWLNFKVRVLSGNKMGGTKKYNLLREKFTEDDMKNFISRDLNNTRYATRHIAEYLRKYFSFENSKNSNIKDVNRIRVLGGGITAKLRHLWGLDKNRDESNLHHALDATVIACTSFSNIYYICGVLKALEEKGIRPKKTQLAPWKTFKEDLYNFLNKITVSKLVRATATGQAHKQPNKKKKGTLSIKRANSQNAITVELDSMFRYDVYRDDNGYYCVPIYAIDLHLKDFKHIATRNKSDFEAKKDDFVFSLYKGSYVRIVNDKNEIFDGYVVQFNAGTGQFIIESVNGDYHYEINTSTFKIGDCLKIRDRFFYIADFNAKDNKLKLVSQDDGLVLFIDAETKDSKEKDAKSYKTPITYTKMDKEKKISISTIQKFQKFIVDRLGNLTLVKRETERFSNKLKSNKQRLADRKTRKEKFEKEQG